MDEAHFARVQLAPPRDLPVAEPRWHEARSMSRRGAPVSNQELVSVGGGSRAQRAHVVDECTALALEEERVQATQVSRREARTGLPNDVRLRALVLAVPLVPLLVLRARAPTGHSRAARAPKVRVRLWRFDRAHVHGEAAPCSRHRSGGAGGQRAAA